MFNRGLFGLSLLCFLPFLSFGQKPNSDYQYAIKRATSKLNIDGKADEAAWENAETISNFHQVLPMDTSLAEVKTDVKLCFDDKNLYILFINHDTISGPLMVESMRRDFSFSKNDNDLLFIDTFNDLTTGFSFGSNARGGQWDGLMSNGSRIDLSWDNKWESEVSFTDDYWVWEAAIPFKTLRYKKETTSWGINFSRNDLKSTEKSSWTPVPRQFPTASLAFTGDLIWEKAPPKPGLNIALIPYINVGGAFDQGETSSSRDYTGNVGFDAKIGLTSAMNLDLTVNPDFSQVDVDEQVTNLNRFELFFPERRQFFLENGDIFNNFGFSSIRPFFSRRIGLNAPIYYGAKLSGKVNKNWRLGAMSMQTGRDNDNNNPGSSFNIFSVQRQVFKRSTIGAIFVNRDLIGSQKEGVLNPLAAFNRTLGLEFNLASEDNQWTGKAFALKTFSPIKLKENTVFAGNIDRRTKHWKYGVQFESVGDGIEANEVGFVPRKDYVFLNPDIAYLFFPKKGPVLSHGPSFMWRQYFSQEGGKSFEYLGFLKYGFTFKDRSNLSLWIAEDYQKLQRDFDPTNFVGEKLAAGTEHYWNAYGLEYDSKPQSIFTYALSTRFGGYYAGGNRQSIKMEVGYRFQPYVAILMRANYNQINFSDDPLLPQGLKNTRQKLWLFGPRIDVTLSNKLFITNFLQYNEQNSTINVNARLQWRYSPASDLFLVYSDNDYINGSPLRNRSIVLKYTYWWNP